MNEEMGCGTEKGIKTETIYRFNSGICLVQITKGDRLRWINYYLDLDIEISNETIRCSISNRDASKILMSICMNLSSPSKN